MTERSQGGGEAGPRAARAARLGAALKANIARRKAAARAEPEGEEPRTEGGQAEES